MPALMKKGQKPRKMVKNVKKRPFFRFGPCSPKPKTGFLDERRHIGDESVPNRTILSAALEMTPNPQKQGF